MNKSILSFVLALAAFVFTATQGHTQIVYTFADDGLGNTMVTGSGSTVVTDRGAEDRYLGWDETLKLSNTVNNVLPLGWAQAPVNSKFSIPASSGTLFYNAIPIRKDMGLDYYSGPSLSEWLILRFDPTNLPSGPATASGTAFFKVPFSAFDHLARSIDIFGNNEILFVFGVAPVAPVAPVATGGGGGPQVRYVLIDSASMQSLKTSGLLTGLVVRDLNRSAAYTASVGINHRLKRAQSRGLDSGQGSELNTSNSSSLLRYLAFTQDENMSYKVALGLADAEERTVQVNMVDTLSAQTGTNFNGSTMGGGLPYAMMGVPMMPMAGGASTVHIVDAAPSGKTVIDDSKAVVESEPWKRWEIFTAGDFSIYDQNPLGDLMEGFDTETYAGSVGIEYRLKSWLNLGLAWSYLESDTNMSGNLGDIDLDGNLISTYATAFWKQNWADLLYSYGSFNSDIARNTGLGSTAHGDTDSDSHNVRLNIGRNIQINNNVVTGPIAGLRYANGGVDPYSETGGGTAALNYNGTEFESMVSRVGWQASHNRPTGWGRIVSQVHLAWEHEFMPENGTVGAGLQTSPFSAVTGGSVRRFGGFSSESDGAHPGTDWMSAGAGLRFTMDNGWSLMTDYQGAFFRSNASQHYASVKVGYEW